ncbi:hypothetical protein [Halopiger xanaduensis]|uniref:hypothetical protein n=1 Tax=Halopiger xanaduensis TaxID=387343 RepID=UPI000AF3EB03|nr:hypothetical protein [Halopiger xanaduensis]
MSNANEIRASPDPDAETERPRPDGPDRDSRPIVASRRRRLLAYLRHNGERICRDVVVLGAWALVATVWIHAFGLPRWLCYAATFAGVVGYTRVTSPWSRPYVSPDDLEVEVEVEVEAEAEAEAGGSRRSQESKQRDE